MKICLATVSLAGGGAERCAASLSNYFINHGVEVYHVVFAGSIVYEHSGEILHLETLKDKKNSLWSRWKRFKALYHFIKNHQFDVIIDFRVKEFYVQEYIIHNFIYKKFIQTIHSNHLDFYFPKNSFLSQKLYKNALHFIAVSSEIQNSISNRFAFSNLNHIYNPVDFITIEKLKVESHNIEFKYILGVGRMTDNVKQFDHLIRCYAASILPKEDIKLVLLGDGKLLEQYRKLAQTLDQEENIVFLGNVANPFSFFANALFTVMTSKIEGFPMVLIESLACETPVISYDLHSGPREIIMHNENGILVENQNIVAMTNAMNTMFLNKDLYVHCKQNAKSSVERFSLETIGKQWVKLFNDLQK